MESALGTALSAGLITPLAAFPALADGTAAEVSPAAGTSPVVIHEAYVSGGSAGAAYKNKFVELYNSSDAPVSLDGWSLQYRSATAIAAPSSVADVAVDPVCTPPAKPVRPADVKGQANYGQVMAAYRACLRR